MKCSGGAFWPNEGTKDEYDGDSDRDRQEINSPSDRWLDIRIVRSLVRLGRDESEDDGNNMWVYKQGVVFRETKD